MSLKRDLQCFNFIESMRGNDSTDDACLQNFSVLPDWQSVFHRSLHAEVF